ncbi:MAG: phosphatidate cytidylyltransferase [Caulobacteraceae bacterium]
MLKVRVMSAILLVSLIMFILFFKGLYLYLFVALLSLAGLFEYFKAMKNVHISANRGFGYTAVIIYYMMFLLPIKFERPGFLAVFSVIALFAYEILTLKHNITEIAITLLGIIYIPYLFSHLIFIERLKYGNIILWLPFLTAWFTDTCAYFIGIGYGKTKLCPKVSPKKTVEGAIGGVVGCIGLNLVYGLLVKSMGYDIGIQHFIITGFLCSIASEFGDLAASYIKRFTGVKDFGRIIPGHGGILDRFDSILFTAPVVYYYFLFWGI